MGVVYAQNGAADIDLGPHGAVVGHLEIKVLTLDDGVAAIDHHVALAHGHIWEILLIRVRIFLITTLVVVLLETYHVDLLFLHLRQDVLGDEA